MQSSQLSTFMWSTRSFNMKAALCFSALVMKSFTSTMTKESRMERSYRYCDIVNHIQYECIITILFDSVLDLYSQNSWQIFLDHLSWKIKIKMWFIYYWCVSGTILWIYAFYDLAQYAFYTYCPNFNVMFRVQRSHINIYLCAIMILYTSVIAIYNIENVKLM